MFTDFQNSFPKNSFWHFNLHFVLKIFIWDIFQITEKKQQLKTTIFWRTFDVIFDVSVFDIVKGLSYNATKTVNTWMHKQNCWFQQLADSLKNALLYEVIYMNNSSRNLVYLTFIPKYCKNLEFFKLSCTWFFIFLHLALVFKNKIDWQKCPQLFATS